MSDSEQKAYNTSERTNAQIEAAQTLAAIVESSDDAIVSKDLSGIIKSWNRGAERIFGFTASEAIGRSITIVIPPELRDQEPEILARIGRGERINRYETIRQRKDGTQFPVSLTISPVRDGEGHIVGASKIARDITDLRASQERQELLLREMNHRVKNLFAVAGGVVALSSRSASDAKELTKSIQSRLSALARAHDLILPQGGTAPIIDFFGLVQVLAAPYQSEGNAVDIEGPRVLCGPSASNSFALLLHEFATNSVKYGAFGSHGKVHIKWSIDSDVLTFVWVEESAQTEQDSGKGVGFGSFLVDATARGLGAEIERRWADGNLTITLHVPLSKLAN